MRSVNVSEARRRLAELLDAVEAGEDIVISRRERPVARLVPVPRQGAPFPDRSSLRAEIPAMTECAEHVVRSLRDGERH